MEATITDSVGRPLNHRLTAPGPALGLQTREAYSSILQGGLMQGEDQGYRRLTGSGTTGRAYRRDLNPVAQERMYAIAWNLWETNALAKRLVNLMTDLILGEGFTVTAEDERIQEVIDRTWNHQKNQLATRIREFYNSLSLNGELILPVEVNPISGIPIFGFIDPAQVKEILPDPQNILVNDVIVLAQADPGQPEKRLKVVRFDPILGRLSGEVFYMGMNKLPNSTRGRSDLLPVADYLDLYDTYLFAEVERLQLLSSFVWDYTVEGADPDQIKEKLRLLPDPKPGTVFGHNEKEKLEARTPDLKASDRSEAGRMLLTHIAGTYGFPITYLGDTGSTNATMQGQNDVMMKTPAARQKEFAGFMATLVQFGVEQATWKNPALFEEADNGYKIQMPEIQAKDISRVGGVLSQVVSAMDTAMANGTASRKLAVTTQVAMLKHLGVDADAHEVMEQADEDKEERQDMADLIASGVAAARSKNPNPPVPGDEDPEPTDTPDEGEPGAVQEAQAQQPIQLTVSPVVHVHPGDVNVANHLPSGAMKRVTTVKRDPATRLADETTTVETPVEG